MLCINCVSSFGKVDKKGLHSYLWGSTPGYPATPLVQRQHLISNLATANRYIIPHLTCKRYCWQILHAFSVPISFRFNTSINYIISFHQVFFNRFQRGFESLFTYLFFLGIFRFFCNMTRYKNKLRKVSSTLRIIMWFEYELLTKCHTWGLIRENHSLYM